ncbi:hypothetical protein SLEP1_g37480 [Rubroshorea leprosula]|uniref:Uncharacterized protein n=1 Tax=Rubroshorea leprosula TaxID=152421 RepID=A0AAV5KUR9_9ROSI|nr:hypothetical protein SLEP1_g37480 [Rubroshorea leprosula]
MATSIHGDSSRNILPRRSRLHDFSVAPPILAVLFEPGY